MGIINNSGEKVGKQVADWVNKNLTSNAAEKCANTLFNAVQKIFLAPFDIAMNLVEIIQNKKYSKYIVVTWSIIGALTMLGSLILTLIDGSYPFGSWGLGIAIASIVVIWIAKHPLTITVESTLAKEIEKEILKLDSIPTVATNTMTNTVQGQLYTDDDGELLDDDDELLEDDDDELLEDDDNETSEGIQGSIANDLYDDILDSESATYDDIRDIDPDLSRDILDFLNNKDM